MKESGLHFADTVLYCQNYYARSMNVIMCFFCAALRRGQMKVAAGKLSLKFFSDVAFAFGGFTSQGGIPPSADIYTPSRGATLAIWNNGSNALSPPTTLSTAVVLADGNILNAGGNKAQPPGFSQILNTTDLVWSATSPMVWQRTSTAAILLINGSGESLQS